MQLPQKNRGCFRVGIADSHRHLSHWETRLHLQLRIHTVRMCPTLPKLGGSCEFM